MEADLDFRDQHAWTEGSLRFNLGAASWAICHIIGTGMAALLSQSEFYNVPLGTTVAIHLVEHYSCYSVFRVVLVLKQENLGQSHGQASVCTILWMEETH